jgi:hypothetical protein
MDGDVGPVLREDRSGEWFDLAESDGRESDRFESKGESSDAAEKVEYAHT